MSRFSTVYTDMIIDSVLSLPDRFNYTLEELHNMSDEQFKELDDKLWNIKYNNM